MSTSSILVIRETIQRAIEAESKSNTLGLLVNAALPRMHHTFELSVYDQEAHLVDYLREFIRCAPDSLETLTQIATDTDTQDAFRPLLETAKQYFVLPPSLLKEQKGLYALLGEAYLVHRLVEEADDRIRLSFGASIAPRDMALPNLLVHSVLGEEFGNELDLAVLLATESLLKIKELKEKPLFLRFMSNTKDEQQRRFPRKGAELIQKTDTSPNLGGERNDRVLH